ncbi:TetR family transcriptional regulator C-terminal domain-containing protein [Halosegnis marinus]|uniref:TetR family transcriptional regulator C-terminal domain-containing protein n=1 Tax=Halosegnis marinus TaxID=3034023 RepID=UPI00360C7AC7
MPTTPGGARTDARRPAPPRDGRRVPRLPRRRDGTARAGPHEPAYAERFADLYAAIHDGFAGVIAAGVERGDFADVDPEETATMLVAAASGGLTWGVTIRPSLVAGVREVVDGYLAAELYL